MSMNEDGAGPVLLRDVRVVDFGNNIAGPCASTILGGLGAEVIKVERPDGGDASRGGPPFFDGAQLRDDVNPDTDDGIWSIGFMKRNRGKRSVTLNVKTAEGRDRFLRLLAVSDVLIENGVPGSLDRLDLGIEVLREVNPRLIVCSVSGFGQSGPLRHWVAYDAIVQAQAGLLGDVDRIDASSGTAIADLSATLYATVAVLAALHRQRTEDRGAWLDISMLEACLAFTWEANRDVNQRRREAGAPVRRVAPWNIYPARDGHVMIAAYMPKQWIALKEYLGISHDRFDTRAARLANVDELDALIGERTADEPKWEIARTLQDRAVPCSPVLQPLETIESPQVVAREALTPLETPDGRDTGVVAADLPAWIVGEGRLHYQPRAPALGADNDWLGKLD